MAWSQSRAELGRGQRSSASPPGQAPLVIVSWPERAAAWPTALWGSNCPSAQQPMPSGKGSVPPARRVGLTNLAQSDVLQLSPWNTCEDSSHGGRRTLLRFDPARAGNFQRFRSS